MGGVLEIPSKCSQNANGRVFIFIVVGEEKASKYQALKLNFEE